MDTDFNLNDAAAAMSSVLYLLPALLVSREGNPVQAALKYCADDLPPVQ